MECRRQFDERLVVGFFVAQEVALHFHAYVRGAKDADDPIDEAADAEAAAAQRRTADECDKSAGVPIELFERERAFAFGRPQFHPRDQTAEIAVAIRAIRPGRAGGTRRRWSRRQWSARRR